MLAFIPLYDKPNFPLRSLIATLAISLIGGQCLLWLFTPRVKALPKIFGVGSIHIGPAMASYDKIGSIVCSAILLLLTLGWMKSSRRGLEIRLVQLDHLFDGVDHGAHQRDVRGSVTDLDDDDAGALGVVRAGQ